MNRIQEDLTGTATVLKYLGNSSEGTEIIRAYGVRAYPTFIILDSCGTLIAKSEGIPDAEAMVSLVENIPACD